MSHTQAILGKHAQRRRDFVRMGSTRPVAAPAVSLLLAAGVKPAVAGGYGGPRPTDIDADMPTDIDVSMPADIDVLISTDVFRPTDIDC